MTTTLKTGEVQKAEKLLADYFKRGLDQHQLVLDTNEGVAEQKVFIQVLLENSLPNDKDFLTFMHDRIWAIHETLYTGLLDEIIRANTTTELRLAFRKMLEGALDAPDAVTALGLGKRPQIGTSILSEILCKVYPDQFSIQNKRSEWGLYFILNGANPTFISDMNYDDFIGIAWQVWTLLEKDIQARKLDFDPGRRLWYVDRFYKWIYERPETKEIRRAMGHKD